MTDADVLTLLDRRREQLIERLAAGDGIEAGNTLKIDAIGIEPDAGDPLLAADRIVQRRTAEDDDDIAVALLHAINEDFGAAEAGSYRNPAVHEIAEEQLLRTPVRTEPEQHRDEAADADPRPSGDTHGPPPTGARE